MRTVVVRSFGGPEVLELVEVPIPRTGAGQVRIKVEAAAVNPVDLATRAGVLAEAGLMARREMVGIGWDVAGVVDQVGPGVSGFTAGDRVIGLRDRLGAPLGTYAEFVVLDADAVAPAPRGVSAAHAATLPLNGLTAAQALELLGLREGQSLLVTGAAGGLGGFATQLAAHRGVRVVAVAGAADEERVRGLGAELFVPRDADLADAVRKLVPGGVDAAIDAAVVGVPAHEAVRAGGAFVAVVSGGAPPPLRATRVANVWIRADGPRLAGLARLVETGRLRLEVAGRYPLEEAAAAHERLAKGGVRGRLVIEP
ncbi:MAG: NADP-dependent oxidoreductase [Micromonosporaceae bacterium]|nr:NADP-dependent oxidoreductase [Micromonosporaceae bacterium]